MVRAMPPAHRHMPARDWAYLYETSIAGEYERWMRSWIARNPDRGFVCERLGGGDRDPVVLTGGPDDAVVNEVMGLGLHGPVEDAQIERCLDVFEGLNSAAVFEACPYADWSMHEQMNVRGARVVHHLQVFAMHMTEPPAAVETPGVEVRRVDKRNADDVALAVRTIAGGYAQGREPTRPQIDIVEHCVQSPDSATFLAWSGGRPIGGSSAGVWAGHPCSAVHLNLYQGSTLPEGRGRGAQAALMRARLRWGFEHGARTATVDCKVGVPTERNAWRLGFELVFTKPVYALRRAASRPRSG